MSSLLWHLSFHLIPRASDDRIKIEAGAARAIVNAELTHCWQGRENYAFAALFDPALGPRGGRAGGVERWGSDDDAMVEVWRLPEGLSVYVRIHIISSRTESVERLMRVIRDGQLVIVLNDLRVVEPDTSAITAEIQNVSAARFLASPTQFLKDLNGFA